ncbi:hypothetical protein EJV47_00530 [Hymenobacter gummosus]|uniref:Uncharacterized protein n=1 Tax=Hymenobacter gummosus TaxID=1776032 RepID=A0A3S0H9P5_9BACT|nr:hypothetical protein [Hymenobacter gummosus]RTQ53260.1 hypothetical protein EJV47_00530 [Hymenobacter gummosus]
MLALLLIALPVFAQLFLLLYPRFRSLPVRPQRAYVAATLLGLLTPFAAAQLVGQQNDAGRLYRATCGMMPTSFLLGGLLITATVLPAIAVLHWAGNKLLARS